MAQANGHRRVLLHATIIAIVVSIATSLSHETQIKIPYHRRVKIASSVAKSERRENERRAVSRALCSRCARPSTVCICEGLPSDGMRIASDIHVLVLQHPNENRKKNVSTVPVMPLVLKHFSKKVGYTFDADSLLTEFQDILVGGQRPLLLFPGPDALSLDDDDDDKDKMLEDSMQIKSPAEESSDAPSRLLILFDGTWAEAKRMARDSPSIIDACQQIQFTAATDRCIYDSLRKEPEEHCLSTLESCGQALLLLEPHNINTQMAVGYLTSSLEILVKQQIQQAEKYLPRHSASTEVKDERNRRVMEIEKEIFTSDERLANISNNENHVVLDDGCIMRKLYRSDADLVNKQWERRSPTSINLVHRRIELGQVCCGIFLKDEYGDSILCGSILQSEDGSLGMLHIKEEYRRRGYGSALVSHATRLLKNMNKEGVAYILDGNTASEAVFDNCGWVKECPNVKRQTGSRRSKRKWIYKLENKQ